MAWEGSAQARRSPRTTSWGDQVILSPRVEAAGS